MFAQKNKFAYIYYIPSIFPVHQTVSWENEIGFAYSRERAIVVTIDMIAAGVVLVVRRLGRRKPGLWLLGRGHWLVNDCGMRYHEQTARLDTCTVAAFVLRGEIGHKWRRVWHMGLYTPPRPCFEWYGSWKFTRVWRMVFASKLCLVAFVLLFTERRPNCYRLQGHDYCRSKTRRVPRIHRAPFVFICWTATRQRPNYSL